MTAALTTAEAVTSSAVHTTWLISCAAAAGHVLVHTVEGGMLYVCGTAIVEHFHVLRHQLGPLGYGPNPHCTHLAASTHIAVSTLTIQ